FENDPIWTLSNGNFDDPISGHSGLQKYAFDFVPGSGVGQTGKKILAARPGKVVVAINSEVLSSYGMSTVFVFKGSEYLLYDLSTGVAPGYPRSLTSATSDFKNW